MQNNFNSCTIIQNTILGIFSFSFLLKITFQKKLLKLQTNIKFQLYTANYIYLYNTKKIFRFIVKL